MLDSGCSILIPAHDLFTILYGTRKINCIMYTFTVSMKYRGEYLWLYKNNRFHMYKHKSKSNLDAWQFKNKNKLYFRCFEQQFFCENIHFVGWVVVCYTVVWTGWSSNFSSIHSPGSLFILVFKSSWWKIACMARNWIFSQTAATTFAFSSVFILLLWLCVRLSQCYTYLIELGKVWDS